MKKQAFTLVELIVVVTILAILATIGFVSYSGYLTGVRDTNRIASLTSISDGLELYRTKNDLPNPDEGVNIQIDGVTIANQGYVGVNVLQTIEYSKAGKDPKDDSYYSYYLTEDKKHYQLMAFLEETENLETNTQDFSSPLFIQKKEITSIFSSLKKGEMSEGQRGLNLGISKTNAAVNYSNRHPKVYGKQLGILTDSNNRPIQEVTTNILNFTGGTTVDYIAHLSDISSITGTGKTLVSGIISTVIGKKYSSCLDIYEKNTQSRSVDGIYQIDLDGQNKSVYCDMTTSSGGWTRVDTKIKNEEERIEFVRFLQTTGYNFGAPVTDICLECGDFPQYMRDTNPNYTVAFFCKYKLGFSKDVTDITYLLNDTLKNHQGRDGLFISGENGGLANLGLRSESQSDYKVYEEIYCK